MKLETIVKKHVPENQSICPYCNQTFYKLTPWQRFCTPSHKSKFHNKTYDYRQKNYLKKRELYLSNPAYFLQERKGRDKRYREGHRDKLNAYATKHYWDIRPRYMKNGEIIYLPRDEVLEDLLLEGKTELSTVLEDILNSKLNKELLSHKFEPMPLSEKEKYLAFAFCKSYKDRKVARLKA